MKQTPNSPSSIKEVPNQFDVLVVGSGAAGLYASLCIPSHLRVGLVTKDDLKSGVVLVRGRRGELLPLSILQIRPTNIWKIH